MVKCCGWSQVQLGINGTEPVHVEAIVMDSWLLGFNLLVGNDTIRVTGGITIMPAGVVSFTGKKATVCTAILLDGLRFCAEFDQMQNCWIVKWKWPEGLVSELLHNNILEYQLPKHVRRLDTHGWLLLYPEERLGPLILLMAIIQHNKHMYPVMLIHSWLMLIFVQPSWGNGIRKARMYHCWIWGVAISDWYLKAKDIASCSWVSV